MRLSYLAATAALLALAGAPAYAASVTVLSSELGNLDGPLAYGHQIINDFDNAANANFTYTANNAALSYVRDGSLGLDPGNSAPPPVPVDPNNPNGDYTYETSNYWTVKDGGSFTLAAQNGAWMNGFSFYFGSPDTFNNVMFTFQGANSFVTLSGAALWDANSGANGDQEWGRRVYYGFNDKVTSITMTSTGGNSFEFDGLAASGAVPEPATWAMMIMGFGAAGAAMRRRRTLLA